MGKINFVNKNELVRVLKEIKDEYGQSVMRDPMKFKAFLHDYLPDYSRERRLLEAGIEEGIIEKLLQVKSQNPENQIKILEAFVNQLMRERGLAEEAAEYTVSVFAEAMGIKPEHEKPSIKPEESLAAKAQSDTEKVKLVTQEKEAFDKDRPVQNNHVDASNVQSYKSTEKNNEEILTVQADSNQQYASGQTEEKSGSSILFIILAVAAGVIGFAAAYSSDGSIGLAIFAAIANVVGCMLILYTIARHFLLVIILVIAGFFLAGMDGVIVGIVLSCLIGFFLSIGSSKKES